MTKKIFITLPVADLAASTAFYRALGFELNAQFRGDDTAAMIWSEAVHVMLATHAKWHTLTQRPFPPAGSAALALSLMVDSKDVVDAMNAAATAHGGQADVNGVEDLGFMYTRDVADPDGHVWGVFWMDPTAAPPEQP